MLWLNYHPKTNHIWGNNPKHKGEILLLSNRFKNKGMFVLSYLSSFCIVYHHYYHYYCTWEKSCNIELQMVATKFLGDSMCVCVCGWESRKRNSHDEKKMRRYIWMTNFCSNTMLSFVFEWPSQGNKNDIISFYWR